MIAHAGSLEGRVALVTGAAGGGIGTETVRLLTRRGAKVAVNARPENFESLNALCDELREYGHGGLAVPADVTDSDQVESMYLKIEAEIGTVDLLVANASGDDPACTLSDLDNDLWRRELDSTLTSAFYCARRAIDRMVEAKSGNIVFVSSSAATRGAKGRSAAYAAGKAGLLGLTKQIALMHGKDGVRANAIAPTQIETPRVMRGGRRTAQSLRAYGETLPLGRVGHPTDVAELIVFLLSGASSYLTGQSISIDGGASLAPMTTELAR